MEPLSLLNKNRVDEVTSKSIDSGEVLNKGKKESIWNKEINFSDIFKGKKIKLELRQWKNFKVLDWCLWILGQATLR